MQNNENLELSQMIAEEQLKQTERISAEINTFINDLIMEQQEQM